MKIACSKNNDILWPFLTENNKNFWSLLSKQDMLVTGGSNVLSKDYW